MNAVRAGSRRAARAAAVEQLGISMVGVLDAIHLSLTGWMREHDLTPPLTMTVKLLEQPRSMRWLAEAHNCDASNITGLVDRLERRGLVERLPDPGDRRVTLVRRTPDGQHLADQLRSAAVQALPGLDSLSDEELATLIELLSRLGGVSPRTR